MKPWTRPQDFGTLIAGTYAALSPIWISTAGESGAMWTLLVLGALLAATGIVSLAAPEIVATEWLAVVFGALLFVAPWVFTYTHLDGASWTSWIVGVTAVVLGGSVAATSSRAQQALQH